MSDKIFSVVEAIIKDNDGRILLLQRSKNNTLFVDKWQLPGGKVEFGENVHKAIQREVLEETSCHLKKAKIDRVFSFEDAFNEFKGTTFLMVFSASINGKIKLSSDHVALAYVHPKDIKKSDLTPISLKSIFG